MQNDFFTKEGLLSDVTPIGNPENLSLWTVECFFLWQMLTPSEQVELADITPYMTHEAVIKAMMSLYDGKRWHPLSDHSVMKEEGMSRDNIIAITALGLYLKEQGYASDEVKAMCNAGQAHFWDYRLFQPADKVFFSYTADKLFGKICLPFLRFMLSSSLRNISLTGDGVLDTDPKLLSFVRLFALAGVDKDSWNMFDRSREYMFVNLYEYLNKHPGEKIGELTEDNCWKFITHTYFRDAANPINRIARVIWK